MIELPRSLSATSDRAAGRGWHARMPAGVAVVLCCLLSASGQPAAARQSSPSSVPTAPEPAAATSHDGPRDAAELEAFTDGFMAAYLETANVAGGVVSVVRDGALLFAKGYGFSDVQAREPVLADRTLFRVGSISKLCTWISVMQQVEAGKLDLDTDVNTYLQDLQVPATFPQPITLAHLMSHTPGFEDRVIGLFAHDPAKLRPLGELLRNDLPRRVRPPGEAASYSNHGTALAMHVVEQVTGEEWNDYIERHILGPLGMSHATYRQPLPETLLPDMSKGYRFAGGDFHEEAFELVPLAPVGAESATATDMARFMIANLQVGELDGQRILSAATEELMLSDLHADAPGVTPMAHGFMGLSQHGERIVGHGGDTLWFHSLLALFPERGLGVFLSFNTQGGDPSRYLDAFLDHYFPVDASAPAPDESVDLTRFAGSYRAIRYSHTSPAKLAALIGTVRITAESGELVLPGTRRTRFVPVGPLEFRETDGKRSLIFRTDDAGGVRYLFLSDLPIIAFEPVPATERPSVQAVLLVLALLVFLATVLFWPLAALVRRRHRLEVAPEKRLPASARWILWLAALGFLVYALGMSSALSDPNQIVFGLGTAVRVLSLLAWLALALAAVAVALAVVVWLRRSGTVWGRLAYTGVVVACALFVWQLATWRLLGV